MGTVPRWLIRCCADKKLKAHLAQQDLEDGDLDLVHNPMNDARTMAVEMEALKTELNQNIQIVGQMGRQLREVKKSNAVGRKRVGGSRSARSKAKKGFAPTAIRGSVSQDGAPETDTNV